MTFSLKASTTSTVARSETLYTGSSRDKLPKGIQNSDIPQSLDEIPKILTTSDYFTIQRAGELKIP